MDNNRDEYKNQIENKFIATVKRDIFEIGVKFGFGFTLGVGGVFTFGRIAQLLCEAILS